jgi:hypothetical protein
MTTKEVLKKAKEKIEQGWCQHVIAKDREGTKVPADSPEAIQWCSVGAIASIYAKQDVFITFTPEYNLILKVLKTESLAEWNDRPKRTIEEVLAAFDKAIELADG